MAADSTKPAASIDQWQTAFGGASGTEEPISSASEDDDSVVRAEQSTQDGQESDQLEISPEDSQNTQEDAVAGGSPAAKPETTKETIAVTDETGRKRKIEIDYSDRAAIKKAHLEAAGMRKFQAERDQTTKRYQEGEAKRKELETNWQALETAFQSNGVAGLVDLLEGRNGAYKDHLAKEVDKAKFRERASPDEIDALDFKEQAEKLRKDYDRALKDNEKFKKSVTEEREAAEMKETQSRVNPVFDKYRFAGKLGDQNDEQMFDEMLWTTSLNRLKQFENEGLDISPELVDREFRATASALRKRISVAADKRVTSVIAQKKQEATENVQAKVKSGYNKNSDQEKLTKAIKDGNTGDIFKNWGSFKNILGGSRK